MSDRAALPVAASTPDKPERDEEADPRLLDDAEVLRRLASVTELVEALTRDHDQMCADLDDNRLAIASSVAWLIGDTGRLLHEATDHLRARLTWLAGQNIYPLQPPE